MAKISPASIKYMIYADFYSEGALERPDVVGALFGQTEGLLGSDLEMRDLQQEGKIGRIEVNLERKGKRTIGKIKIPTALDQSETSLIAAAIETVDRIGPSDSQIEVTKIEDVRGSKRDYILERAEKLLKNVTGTSNSREISGKIKDSRRTGEIQKYGDENLPCGDLSEKELIVVEGRADVVNLLKAGVKNVIGMNGSRLPDAIKELGKEKDITLFVDGDRGGKLIIQNVLDNVNVKYIAIAPSGKEVEELTGKEILMKLRKKVSVDEYLKKEGHKKAPFNNRKLELNEEMKSKIKKIYNQNKGKRKAIFLDGSLEEIKKVSARGLGLSLKKTRDNPKVIILDGAATSSMISNAEKKGCDVFVATNFNKNSESMKLLSF